MKKFITSVLGLISKKLIAKYLPDILANLFTRLFDWLLKNGKGEKIVDLIEKIIKALSNTLEYYRNDKKFDAKEIIALREDWKDVVSK